MAKKKFDFTYIWLLLLVAAVATFFWCSTPHVHY